MTTLKTAAQANYQVKRRAACEHRHIAKSEHVGPNLRISGRTQCLDCGYYQDKTLPHQP